MQTFLPYADFKKSVKCLDWRRLGKQRVEAYQILRILKGITNNSWSKHPATLMWKGNEDALSLYHNIVIEHWVERGYKNNMDLIDVEDDPEMPWWFGMDDFHAAHRSNLLRKDPVHYSKFGWVETDNLEYVWPSKLRRRT